LSIGLQGLVLRFFYAAERRRSKKEKPPGGRFFWALHIGSFLFADWEVFSKAAQPFAGRLGWGVRIGSRAGGFSLTKAPHKPGKLNFVQFHVAQDKSKTQQNI
jgi:hypothetical protein